MNLMISKKIWLLFVTCFIISPLSKNPGVKSQTTSFEVLLENSQGFVVLDLSNKEDRVIYTFQNPSFFHSSALSGNTAYVIDREELIPRLNNDVIKESIEAKIEKINLETGQQETVLEGYNFTRIILSPSNDKAIVIYFSPDNAIIRQACILDLKTSLCDSVGFDVSNSIVWLDDNQALFVLPDYKITIYNSIDSSTKILSEFANWISPVVTPIPNSKNMLLVSGVIIKDGSYEGKLVSYSLDNYKILDYPLDIYDSPYDIIDDIKISPDGEFLAYSFGDQYEVVDLETGMSLTQFKNIRDLQWLPDRSGIIGVVLSDTNKPIYDVFLFDIQSQTFTAIKSYNEILAIRSITAKTE